MLSELDKLAKDGLSKIKNIKKSISETASTVEENAASSEETPAAIEEQTAAMQQVSNSVTNVGELAQKTVDSLLNNFKISEESKNSHPLAKQQSFDRKRKLGAH